MKMLVSSFLAAGLIVSSAALPAQADGQSRPRSDQDAALEARMQGRILPVREIERRVVPQMRGSQYLGFDFDAGTRVYTLKFMRDGNVVWVHVDGASGRVVGRSGN
jgi:hypothetical protein